MLSPAVARTAHVQPFRMTLVMAPKAIMRLETIEASEDAKPRYRYLQPCNRHKTKREGIGLVRGTT